MSDTRVVPMDVILTGTTGVMLCREGFGKFQEFAEFMANGPVWTHELVALAPILRAEILRQHPDLPTDADVDGETWRAWLDDAVAKYGASREVSPIPDYSRTTDPLTTAMEMVGAEKVIVGAAPDREGSEP